MPKIALLLAFFCSLATPECFAHARLSRAEPAARSTLNAAPTRLRLSFNEAVEAKYSSVELRGPSGAVSGLGPLSAPEERTLELALPPLPAGRYDVHYRVLSADGHVIEADYRFSVQDAPAAQ